MTKDWLQDLIENALRTFAVFALVWAGYHLIIVIFVSFGSWEFNPLLNFGEWDEGGRLSYLGVGAALVGPLTVIICFDSD